MNVFKRKESTPKTPSPETPYQQAQAVWDDRIGAARAQAKNWRIMAFFNLFISIALLIILLTNLPLKQNKLFVVETAKDGAVVNVAPLQVTYNPNEAQKEYFTKQFIQWIRSVPLDPVVARNNWMNAYNFLTPHSGAQLKIIMTQHNPAKDLGKKTVTVNKININLFSGDNTFLAQWTETTVPVDGGKPSTKNYTGTFTLVIKQPTEKPEILNNPLGIYVADFHFNEGQ